MSPDDPSSKANDIVGAAKDGAATAVQRMSSAIGDARDHASNLTAKGRDAAADFAASAQQSLGDAADRIPKVASDAIDLGGQFYARGSAGMARQVRKQPMEALLLASAIGFLVGWAVNRS